MTRLSKKIKSKWNQSVQLSIHNRVSNPKSPHNNDLSREPSLARVLAGAAGARTVTIGESVSKSLLCGIPSISTQ
jgi:hypothetical protein